MDVAASDDLESRTPVAKPPCFKTQEGAKQEWERIKRQNADILGTLSYIADRVDLGDRGTFFRVQIGPIADGTEAERICSTLRERKVGCILVKP